MSGAASRRLPVDALAREEVEAGHEEIDFPAFVGDLLDAVGIVGRDAGQQARVVDRLDVIVHLAALALANSVSVTPP